MSRVFAVALLLLLQSCGQKADFSRAALPIGNVDLPQPKTEVAEPFQVSGWAAAHEPLLAAAIYIDSQFVTAVPVAIARPDVAAAKPEYKNAVNSGFGVMIDPATLAPGWHEIVVQARTASGAVRDLATVPILVRR